MWKFTLNKKIPKIGNIILIEGLPGIGNVGKIAIDFIANELKAKQFASIFSYDMPNSVFVNERDLVELPYLAIHHAKVGKQDYLFLIGDFQPTTERSCFEFCDQLIDFCSKHGLKQIITLGGVGLSAVPKDPKVFCTGTDKKQIQGFAEGTSAVTKLFGIVGPIIGVSGLLLGLAAKRKIDSITLLAETYGHPMYLGMAGAREIVDILNRKFRFKLDIAKFDRDIKSMESSMAKAKELRKAKEGKESEVNYIG